jgi:hypothetical protein
MDTWAKKCHHQAAFVALVKPLDIFKGLQVHTCSPFCCWLEAVGKASNSSNRKETLS